MVTGDPPGDFEKLPRASPNQLRPVHNHTVRQGSGSRRNTNCQAEQSYITTIADLVMFPVSIKLRLAPGNDYESHMPQTNSQSHDSVIPEFLPQTETLDFQTRNSQPSNITQPELMIGVCSEPLEEQIPPLNCSVTPQEKKAPNSANILGKIVSDDIPPASETPTTEDIEALLIAKLGEGSMEKLWRMRNERLAHEQPPVGSLTHSQEALWDSFAVDLAIVLGLPLPQNLSADASHDESKRLDVDVVTIETADLDPPPVAFHDAEGDAGATSISSSGLEAGIPLHSQFQSLLI